MVKKKQIRINEATIKALVKEAVQDKLNGVFSTDDPKAADAVRGDTDWYDDWYGESYSTKKGREDLANLIDRRSNGEDAELPLVHSRADDMDDEYFANATDEKTAGERYDVPFGDLDDTENQWDNEEGYEDEEYEEPYEMYEGKMPKQVRLNEVQFRNFISYSVAKILREMKGMDLHDMNGEYDGYEEADYGDGEFVFEPDIDDYISEDLDFPEYPKVKVYYTKTQGRRSYDSNDYDDYELQDWKIINPQGMPQEVIDAVKYYMENDFDIEEAANGGSIAGLNEGWDSSFSERVHDWDEKHPVDHSKGAKVGGDKLPKPGNPYKDMNWDEYCDAKKKEHKKSSKDGEDKPKKPNRGVTTHFNK